jgi:phage terminase large subunit-like protein
VRKKSRLRGPQAEFVVIDEIARMRYQEHVFDMAMLGLRLGDKPRMFIMTTPRPTPFIKRLVKMDGVSITTGSTYDNAEHLSADVIKKIVNSTKAPGSVGKNCKAR